jgi:hypothetical protein
MRTRTVAALAGVLMIASQLSRAPAAARSQDPRPRDVVAPLVLDHNRAMVDAEMQASDGTWRAARLWIDTGNPEFMVNETFARALGFDVPPASSGAQAASGPVSLPPVAVRVNGVPLDFKGLTPAVHVGARQWATMHADANLPSTVLQRYRVAIDYPGRRFELTPPGRAGHRGVAVPARIHPQTGIAQVDALIGGERFSLAVDIGASYSFVSAAALSALAGQHAGWPRATGAFGCANIWGLWPGEDRWPVLRAPELRLGAATIAGVGLVGLPNEMFGGSDLGSWYSQKTAAPVVGFLGPNAFAGFRLEIDYMGRAVHLDRRGADAAHDMDVVGLTLQPASGRWRVLGSTVEGVEAGDVLLQVGERAVAGATMGTVVDALRGAPGDLRVLTIERGGRTFRVEARVRRHL